MAIQKLNIHVTPGQKARASDFNAATGKIDEVIDALNSQQDQQHVFLEPEAFAELKAADCQEGVLYFELGDVVDSVDAWRFGEPFPIRLL